MLTKKFYAVFLLPALFAFQTSKPAILDWSLITETSWEQRSDETTNENVWIPTFGKKLRLLDMHEVSITGYISVDEKGNHVLTQFRRNPKSTKDRTGEPPDYILLDGFDVATYYAALKKYELKGTLILKEYADGGANIELRMPVILK